ncbi:MAG: biopolymer transporter ExbD [Deltaproteobacteria bacterium]|nr:biopolymer transporter ExbD [Deltaproteobacteria bacterium]
MRRAHSRETVEEPNLIPVMNMVCLLIPFLLLTATFIQYAVIGANAPRLNPVPGEPSSATRPLELTVLVTDQGFRITAAGRILGTPGEADASEVAAPAVPMTRSGGKADYDYSSLQLMLREIKDEHEGESAIRIGAERNIDYATVVKVMDATRADVDGELFPDVVLLAGVI